MPDRGARLTAFHVAKKDIMPGTALSKKDEEQKPTLLTSTQKKKLHTKGAKQKAAE
jgi:hypothetical protein